MRITHKTPNVSVTNDDLPAGQMAGSYGWVQVWFEPGFTYARPTLPPGWVECEQPEPNPHLAEFYVHMDHAIWHDGGILNIPRSIEAEWPEDPRCTHEVWVRNDLDDGWSFSFRGTRDGCLKYLDAVSRSGLWEFSIRPVKR